MPGKESHSSQTPRIHEIFVYLCVDDPEAAIKFYTNFLGARELFRLTKPDGGIAHLEFQLGSLTVMMSGEYPEYGIQSPKYYGGTGTVLHLHVDDVDSLAEKVEKAGADIVIEPNDQPHGERQCRFRDPFGHEWLLGHSIENVSEEEMQRRFNESFK